MLDKAQIQIIVDEVHRKFLHRILLRHLGVDPTATMGVDPTRATATNPAPGYRNKMWKYGGHKK